MTPETRVAVAMSAAGHWIGYVHGERAEQVINDAAGGIGKAIENAMEVKITHEVIMAFLGAPDDPEDISGPLAAAFRAAGFRVVES